MIVPPRVLACPLLARRPPKHLSISQRSSAE